MKINPKRKTGKKDTQNKYLYVRTFIINTSDPIGGLANVCSSSSKASSAFSGAIPLPTEDEPNRGEGMGC